MIPLYWLVRMWRNFPDSPMLPAGVAFWGRLLPFAGAVWVNNLLQNLFLMTDRYMILHHSGMNGDEAAAAVGQYHSARVVPLLLVQLSVVISTMFVPYFSCGWEAGRAPRCPRPTRPLPQVDRFGADCHEPCRSS